MIVRPYQHTDYESISQWWLASSYGGVLPPDWYSPESCYVLELKGKAAVAITVFYTQLKVMAMLENLIADPSLEKEVRAEAVDAIVNFCEVAVKSHGYKNLVCYSPKQGLANRYTSLGYKPVMKLTCHMKEM